MAENEPKAEPVRQEATGPVQPSHRTRSDVTARIVGMLVFLLGVFLLLLVFYIAYGLFQAPASQALGLRFTNDPKKDPQLPVIGAQFTWLLFRLGYLFLMSIAGSLIANKGVSLYFSSLHGGVSHPVERPVQPPQR